MRVEELMKRDIACLVEGDNVQSAARKMRENNLGFLPVCQNGMKPIGTLTDRDITIRVAAEDKLASKTQVRDVMTREVVSCMPGDELRRVQELMGRHHKSRMMVCDDSGKLVGVISLSDLAVSDEGRRVADTMKEVSSREVRA